MPSLPALVQLKTITARAGFSVAPPAVLDMTGFALRPAVLQNFFAWSTMFEGYETFMYTDVKGLVTTGIGNLIDPIASALVLPWQRPDGSVASANEITGSWHAVKAAWPDVQSVACGRLTTLRLPRAAVATLVAGKLRQNDAYLAARFSEYASWPADAQLALNSMAWAMGPGFNFPALKAALVAGDFAAAAKNCTINPAGNPGVIPRNTADEILFANAAVVSSGVGDPDTLYFLDAIPDAA